MKLQIDDVVRIRLAKSQDRDDIVRIQLNAFKVLAAKDYDREQLEALIQSKSTPRDSNEIIFIAEIDGQPVGFAALIYPFNTINAVFVDPDFARRGVGSKLLQTLEREAVKHNVPILWVCSSLTGHNFYRANGYRTLRTTVFPLYSTYIPCRQMKKRILPITLKEVFDEVSQLLMAMGVAILLISFFAQIA